MKLTNDEPILRNPSHPLLCKMNIMYMVITPYNGINWHSKQSFPTLKLVSQQNFFPDNYL